MIQQQTNPSDTLTIFTDGACSFNPGPGGWAARLLYRDGRVVELGGFVPETTNNRMELQAAIEGLRAAPSDVAITLVTDSEYLRKGITEWIHGWKKRGWHTAAKKPVLNQDLWQLARPTQYARRPVASTPKATLATQTTSAATRSPKAFSRGETPSLNNA